MSYKVPKNPPLPKRWPHWYSLLSLAFHGVIIWQGLVILSFLPFFKWQGGQQFLFIGSGFIGLICLVSAIYRNNAAWVVLANVIYSISSVPNLLFKGLIFPLSQVYLFSGIQGFVMIVLLANIPYTLYRFFTPMHEE